MPNEPVPDLESLRCFVVLAGGGSFRAAAKEVGLSPAAFSARIAALEESLGARLFHRSTRSVELSEAGLRLRPEAESLLADARGLRRRLLDEGPPTPYELTIGTRYELGMSWLVPALAELEAERPERRIHLAFSNGGDLLTQLRTREIDAFIASIRLSRADLVFRPLHEEHYVLVGAPAMLRERPFRHPEDAADHRLLDIDASLPLFRYFLDAAEPTETWAFGARQYLGTIGALRARALEGAGIAVLPLYFVREDLRAKRLRRLVRSRALRSDWFRLVWREGHPAQARLQELADALSRRPLA